MPFDITQLNPESIIYGGLTLISLSLSVVLYRISKFYFNHTNDVIKDNTQVIRDHVKAQQKMSDSHDRLADAITNLINKL